MITIRKSLLALATLATLAGAGFATPAAAWDDWGRRDRGWHDDRGGWGGWERHGRPRWEEHRRSHWQRERCWIEPRRVRVHTPWGPRFEIVERRVCR